MSSLPDRLPSEVRKKLRRRSQPSWVAPMLAVLTDRRFSDEGWIFEPKFDGERCLAFKAGRRVDLLSRNRKPINNSYPELVEALEKEKGDFIVDGEVVTFRGEVTSFAQLQPRMHLRDPEAARRTKIPVFYYLFDLLFLNGYETSELPLRERKFLLSAAIEFKDPLRFTPHREAEGEKYLEEVCAKGWEGVIGKKADAPYIQKRSSLWLKMKCSNQQEFVIGGYTDPKGTREELGALLIGYYEDGRLRYAGKVGTGFDRKTLRDLSKRLRSLKAERPPFSDYQLSRKGVHWVRPELVAQVAFTEWTRDGKLRHPRFSGLRRDKSAKEVIREKPK